MLAFTINVLYLISLLLVPNPPVEAKTSPQCMEIATVLAEAVERGEMTSQEMAKILGRCDKYQGW